MPPHFGKDLRMNLKRKITTNSTNLSYDSENPLDWVHSTAEGMLEFTVLFSFQVKLQQISIELITNLV